MGIVYSDITLTNAIDMKDHKRGLIKEEEIRQISLKALVDTR